MNFHISGEWGVKEKDPIFVDRNPKMFAHILDFLRKGKVNMRADIPWLKNLSDEAEYYGISELMELVRNELDRVKERELEADMTRRSSPIIFSEMRSIPPIQSTSKPKYLLLFIIIFSSF